MAQEAKRREAEVQALHTSTPLVFEPQPQPQPQQELDCDPEQVRCLLTSLRHADRELRTARSAIEHAVELGESGEAGHLGRSRTPDREEMEAQLVEAKLQVAQLEMERDECQMALRQLKAVHQLLQATNAAASTSARPKPERKLATKTARKMP